MLRSISGNEWVQSFPECVLLIATLSLNLLTVSGQNQLSSSYASSYPDPKTLFSVWSLSFSYRSKTCVTYSDPLGYFMECMR